MQQLKNFELIPAGATQNGPPILMSICEWIPFCFLLMGKRHCELLTNSHDCFIQKRKNPVIILRKDIWKSSTSCLLVKKMELEFTFSPLAARWHRRGLSFVAWVFPHASGCACHAWQSIAARKSLQPSRSTTQTPNLQRTAKKKRWSTCSSLSTGRAHNGRPEAPCQSCLTLRVSDVF